MLRRPRFCLISTFYPPYSFGGDAMYLYRLANGLAMRGHEVDVVHSVDAYNVLSSSRPRQKYPQHSNITVHSLKSRWGWVAPLLAQQTGHPLLNRDRLQAILYSKKFDVIHFHNISLFGPGVLALEPDYTDYIKLYTMHEHWLVCPMHVLWKNNRRLCDKPTCFSCTLAFRRPPQWWRYTDLLARSTACVDAFISPSRFTANMHHERGFSRSITHIPHFVPEAEPQTGPATASTWPRPYFLFVGRLEKIKGVQELIPVFRNYRHADLLIAGAGRYEAELRRLAAGVENVIFLGPLPQDRLSIFYRNALALVVPSAGYETFGIIVIEAFTEKTPAIVNGLGGLAEVVEESGGGLVYRSQPELLRALEKLQTDPQLRAQLGEKGYQTHLKRWSEDAHFKMYFNLIDRVAKEKFGNIPWQNLRRADLRYPTVLAAQAPSPLALSHQLGES